MKCINRVTLLGRAGKDAECRTIGSNGTLLATFSIATSKRYKDSGGEWQEKTEWHNVKVFSKLAEVARDYVRKGQRVLVDGELQTESWDDKQTGRKQYKTVVMAETLLALDAKPEQQQQQGSYPPKSYSQPQSQAQMNPEITDDDIPF